MKTFDQIVSRNLNEQSQDKTEMTFGELTQDNIKYVSNKKVDGDYIIFIGKIKSGGKFKAKQRHFLSELKKMFIDNKIE